METVPPTSDRGASHENLQSDSRENSQSGFTTAPQQTTVLDINKIDENNNETNTATNSGTSTTENDATGGHDAFECNICFETAKDAIVTLCGHLFCWPCLHAWLEQKPPGIQTCPVCKSAVDRDRVVPLYGRGNQRTTSASGSQQSKPVDPRTKTDDANNLPNRPRGQWQQAPNDQNDFFSPFFGTRPGGVHVSFGVGSFPFGFFNANIGGTVGIDNQVDPNLMSTLFLLLGMLLVAWVIFA